MGYATFVNFVRVYCICVYYKFIPLKSIWFFLLHSVWEIELTKRMTELEDEINLSKNAVDDNYQERKTWSCLRQTCSRSMSVFLSQLFVVLLIIFGCFWRIHFSKTCDESTVWVGILCSAAGFILPSPRLWTSQLLQTIESLFQWLVRPKLENLSLFKIGLTLKHFNQSLTKFTFF